MDYYGNPSNDGNISFIIANRGTAPFVFEKGDKIGQGFFINFLTVDNEVKVTQKRTGGFGSTGK